MEIKKSANRGLEQEKGVRERQMKRRGGVGVRSKYLEWCSKEGGGGGARKCFPAIKFVLADFSRKV